MQDVAGLDGSIAVTLGAHQSIGLKALVLMGNDEYLLRQIDAGERERAREYAAWLLGAAGGYAIKIVNPGGIERWKQGARDRIYWFFSLDYAGRRQYSEDTATNVYYEQMATHWGNWAKLFFNNKGVAAHGTDICANYPPNDPTVWDW